MTIYELTRLVGLTSLGLILIGWAVTDILISRRRDWDILTGTLTVTGVAGGIYVITLILNVADASPFDVDRWIFEVLYGVLTVLVLGVPVVWRNVWRAIGARRAGRFRSGDAYDTLGEGVFATLAGSLPIAIADPDGTIRYTTPALDDLAGASTTDSLVGHHLTTLIPERFRDRHLRAFARYQRTGESRILGRVVSVALLRRDGVEVPVSLALTAAQVGDNEWFLGALWQREEVVT